MDQDDASCTTAEQICITGCLSKISWQRNCTSTSLFPESWLCRTPRTPTPPNLLVYLVSLECLLRLKHGGAGVERVNTATLKTEALKLPELAIAQTITVQAPSLPTAIQMLPSIKIITKFSNLCQKKTKPCFDLQQCSPLQFFIDLALTSCPPSPSTFCSSPSLPLLTAFVFLTYRTRWLNWLKSGTSPEQKLPKETGFWINICSGRISSRD